MSNIDLGDTPIGDPPSSIQQNQIRNALGITNQTGQQVVASIDAAIGDFWKNNGKFIFDNGDPNNATFPNYQSPLTIQFGISPLSSVELIYAGLYNGRKSYTLGGVNPSFYSNPFTEPNYTVLYYEANLAAYIFRYYDSANNQNYIYMNTESYDAYIFNAVYWQNYNTSAYNEIASFAFFEMLIGYPATKSLEIYQDISNSYTYISNFDNISQQFYWQQIIIGINGSAPFTQGGTEATSQIGAINNLFGYILEFNSGGIINDTHKGCRFIANNASGTATFTILSNAINNQYFTCSILRAGAGDVVVSAGTGVTLRSLNNHRKISNPNDLIHITRIGQNDYVISGNLKA